MENIYSVTVKNKFALTDDDEDKDPFEILKLQEQEKEAKRKEKLSEKSKHHQEQQQQQKPGAQQQQQQSNKKNSRLNKENQGQPQQPQQQQLQPQQQQQPSGRGQDQAPKKDQGDKKPSQQRIGNERNVKFAENREEHNNRRNREEGERPPRIQNENRRGGPPGGDYPYQGSREFRNSNIGSTGPDGERRGRGGPRGGFRGSRGGYRGRGNYDNRGKREYDRQSGSDKTGVKPIDKKDGAGSHNWGTHNDEIEEGLNQSDDWGAPEKIESDTSGGNLANESKDSSGSATNVSGGEAPATGDAAPATEEKTAEEEARELTLDEWKALKQTNRAKPTYNLRKAGEGEDLSRWKKMYALERKKEGAEEDEDEEEEYDAAEYPQRAGRQKHVFDIEINFNDSRRSGGRGGRGGRGGNRMNGRGFGNRGPPREPAGEYRSQEQRSPRERQNAPKVDDEHDFPSLG